MNVLILSFFDFFSYCYSEKKNQKVHWRRLISLEDCEIKQKNVTVILSVSGTGIRVFIGGLDKLVEINEVHLFSRIN